MPNQANSNLYIKYILFFLLIFSFIHKSFAEEKTLITVTGTVKSLYGEPLEFVSVYVKNSTYGCTTDEKGKFTLEVPSDEQQIEFAMLGYKAITEHIGNRSGKNIHIMLEEDTEQLSEVKIVAKSGVKKVNESAFNVTAIGTKALQHTTLDLAHALDRISGVKLRESGGVGSSSSITLNGFSGQHVKIFMDGVPMSGFGSSFQLNNIPIDMAERIEVYKGVVPVEFGGDAIGGAINVVTRKSRHTSLNVSYSYGSFNTHKSSINFSHIFNSGFMTEINAYQNYSDNNYKVDVHLLREDNNGKYDTETTRVKRFHDTYHNEAVIANIGFVKKSFADRLLIGVVLGKNKADVQNANDMDRVFGERFTEGNTIMPTLRYEKNNIIVKNLRLSLNGNFNFGYNQTVDTVQNRKYSWLGYHYYRLQTAEQTRRHTKSRDNNGAFTANLSYKYKNHSIVVNDVFSTFKRQNEDLLASHNDDNYPSVSQTNTLGISYSYTAKKWNANAFYKHYYQYVEAHLDSSKAKIGEYYKVSTTFPYSGYGIAATYFPWEFLQFKGSYEKTVRLPTARELFGDNNLEIGNLDIEPETSDNYNINASFNCSFNRKHEVIVEFGYMYRNIEGYIRRSIDSQGDASSASIGRVVNKGINTELRYYYDELLTLGGNFSFLNIRSQSDDLLFRGQRIPNRPYVYGNADASIFFRNVIWKGCHLTIGYNLNYVYRFYLNWPELGGTKEDIVPTQLSHDIDLSYTIQNGRFTFSFECRNIADANLYDNYSLQKPGRAFSGKIKYHFTKGRNYKGKKKYNNQLINN